MEEKPKDESFKANARSNRKWNRLKRCSQLCEQEEVKWSTMRKQWRSKSEGEDFGIVIRRGCTQWRKIKVK